MLKTLKEGKGNYRILYEGNVIKYFYHGNCIGIVNLELKTIIQDDCGWGSYRSTKRALNDLGKLYPGYEIIRK